jgi:hypothetical protein
MNRHQCKAPHDVNTQLYLSCPFIVYSYFDWSLQSWTMVLVSNAHFISQKQHIIIEQQQ